MIELTKVTGPPTAWALVKKRAVGEEVDIRAAMELLEKKGSTHAY